MLVDERARRTVAGDGRQETVRITPAASWAFEVTPSHYVTALVTERGSCAASAERLAGLYPDLAA